MPDQLSRYIVEKGSITVDGVSLTVAEVRPLSFTVWTIPHTREVTTLGRRNPGDLVNIECDPDWQSTSNGCCSRVSANRPCNPGKSVVQLNYRKVTNIEILGELETEARNPRTINLDTLTSADLVDALHAENYSDCRCRIPIASRNNQSGRSYLQ